jgi:hypothetical protein
MQPKTEYICLVKNLLFTRNMRKKIYLLLLVCIHFVSFGQNRIPKDQLSDNWLLINSKDGVEFYAKMESVDVYKNGSENLTFAVIKVINTNSNSASVNFLISGYYDGGCLGCSDGKENSKSISLNAGETFIGTAENGYSRLVRNPMNKLGWNFEAIGINNLTIKN